jgi:hypothetical protein
MYGMEKRPSVRQSTNPTKSVSQTTLQDETTFLEHDKADRKLQLRSMRYQTMASAVMVINAPRTAVKPQMNTIIWRFK